MSVAEKSSMLSSWSNTKNMHISNPWYKVKGIIDEAEIYNRALTLEEIQQEFQNGALKKPGANIVDDLWIGSNFWNDYMDVIG